MNLHFNCRRIAHLIMSPEFYPKLIHALLDLSPQAGDLIAYLEVPHKGRPHSYERNAENKHKSTSTRHRGVFFGSIERRSFLLHVRKIPEASSKGKPFSLSQSETPNNICAFKDRTNPVGCFKKCYLFVTNLPYTSPGTSIVNVRHIRLSTSLVQSAMECNCTSHC